VVAPPPPLAHLILLADTKPSSSWFTGIPSPAAGCTLAVYYPFSQTAWYRASLAYLDLQHQGLVVLILLLAALMVSNVKYPRFPAIGLRSLRGLSGLLVHLAVLAGGLLAPEPFLFPLALVYPLLGVGRALILGLLERSEGEAPSLEPLVDGAAE